MKLLPKPFTAVFAASKEERPRIRLSLTHLHPSALRRLLPRAETLAASKDPWSLFYIFGGWGVTAISVLVSFSMFTAIGEQRDRLARALTITPDVNYITFAPATDETYRQVVADLKGEFPSVDFTVNHRGLFVKGAGLDDYGNWIAALEAIAASNRASRWTINDLCIGERCPSHEPTATLSAQILTSNR